MEFAHLEGIPQPCLWGRKNYITMIINRVLTGMILQAGVIKLSMFLGGDET